MDNYVKDSVVEVTDNSLPFGDCCAENVIQMNTKIGTKVRNIIDYSMKHFVDKPTERQIVVTGCADGANKAISCAEIVKRKYELKVKRDLFQMTRIGYKLIEEYWKPKDSNLDRLKVNRKIPKIYILLSKDPLDMNEPGVQHKDSISTNQFIDKFDFNRNKNKSKSRNSPKISKKSNNESNNTNEAKGSALDS